MKRFVQLLSTLKALECLHTPWFLIVKRIKGKAPNKYLSAFLPKVCFFPPPSQTSDVSHPASPYFFFNPGRLVYWGPLPTQK